MPLKPQQTELFGEMGTQIQGPTPFVTFHPWTYRICGLSAVGTSLLLCPHTSLFLIQGCKPLLSM